DAVLGIGIVADEYDYEEHENFPHQKAVNWSPNTPTFNNKEGRQTTIHQLTDPSLINKIDALLKTTDSVAVTKSQVSMQGKPLNQILFGPPGTGKTYNTVNKALEIIGEDIKGKTRKEIKDRFDKAIAERQIVFTTFHQSMSYEDFIEGIKPETTEGGIVYNVKLGIFRQICQAAVTPNQIDFNTAYSKLVKDFKEDELLKLFTPTSKEFAVSLNNNGNLTVHTGTDKNKQGSLTKENLQKQINGEEIFTGWDGYFKGVIKHLETKYGYSSIPKGGLENFVLIIDEINRGNVSQIFGELITLIEEDKRLGKDEAVRVTLPYSKEKDFSVPPNLYIIGTMNTADRSVEALDAALRRRFCFEELAPKPELVSAHRKIWELWWKHPKIKWQDEPYKTEEALLYDLLGVKNNFAGKAELWSKLEKEGMHEGQIAYFNAVPVEGINPAELLTTINTRIEKLLDKDHQIGHSYFMQVTSWETLKNAFQNQIIPLLQEYFFGDYGKIGLVLGKGFVRKKEWDNSGNSFADFEDDSAADFSEKPVYQIVDFSNAATGVTEFKKAIYLLLKKDFA
ncbi:MAG: AAA family ATPase, partial [Chitinophagales bacterium]|nr:AAA family ATPase [Chitinophagales bacterium]